MIDIVATSVTEIDPADERILSAGTDGTVRHHAEIETHGMPMIHDCALTPS